ncbi:DUF2946 family protein [Methylobrevis pamukkalensis]|nr:DUF2946 family protein [Methylobrevis pamukkalensis]
MTGGTIARQAVRIWVAMIAAYVLVLQSVLPVYAVSPVHGAGSLVGVLCQRDAGTPSDPAGTSQQGDICCILCVAPSLAASNADPVRTALPRGRAAVLAVFAVHEILPRAPPERSPVRSRAPPSVSA